MRTTSDYPSSHEASRAYVSRAVVRETLSMLFGGALFLATGLIVFAHLRSFGQILMLAGVGFWLIGSLRFVLRHCHQNGWFRVWLRVNVAAGAAIGLLFLANLWARAGAEPFWQFAQDHLPDRIVVQRAEIDRAGVGIFRGLVMLIFAIECARVARFARTQTTSEVTRVLDRLHGEHRGERTIPLPETQGEPAEVLVMQDESRSD